MTGSYNGCAAIYKKAVCRYSQPQHTISVEQQNFHLLCWVIIIHG